MLWSFHGDDPRRLWPWLFGQLVHQLVHCLFNCHSGIKHLLGQTSTNHPPPPNHPISLSLRAGNHQLPGLTSTNHPRPPNNPTTQFLFHYGLEITNYQDLPPPTTLHHQTTQFDYIHWLDHRMICPSIRPSKILLNCSLFLPFCTVIAHCRVCNCKSVVL